MAFELEQHESVEAGTRRIVDEQLSSALDDLRAADARTADAAVHATRKRFKRIRAIVRLLRPELGPEVFERENACFRDAGGSLSEARDAAVLIKTLDSLKAECDPAAFTAERRKLLARRRSVTQRVLQAGDGLATVAATIEEARQRVAHWRIPTDGWAALKVGLRRIYAQGRAAFDLAQVGADPELFHEWRKRVKDLWHQAEALELIWPEIMKPLAEELHHLADHLGDEHDLSVLIQLLEADALAKAQPASPIVAVAHHQRLDLERAARALGAKLFAERPKPFVKRLGHYWDAWKSASGEADAAITEPAEPLTPVESPADIVTGAETTTTDDADATGVPE